MKRVGSIGMWDGVWSERSSRAGTWSALAAAAIASVAAGIAAADGSQKAGGDRLPYSRVDGRLLDVLSSVVGPENVSTDTEDREEHGRDAYSFHRGSPPEVIVYPGSTEEVSAVVRACAKHRVPVIPYGGGTSLEGHTLSPYGGVVVDMTRMNQVLAVHADDGDAVVQAGIGWQDLNAYLDEHKPQGSKSSTPYSHLFFPVDPGPGATIGGMVATGCSGTNAVRYGTMKDNVLALKVVLPSGAVVDLGTRARKSSAGLDLTRLMVGSEGTLGIVTEATVRLRPKPATTSVVTVAFPSLGDAARTVLDVLGEGIDVHCMELLNGPMASAIQEQSGRAAAAAAAASSASSPEEVSAVVESSVSSGSAIELPPTPHLFFKLSGSQAAVKEQRKRVTKLARGRGATQVLASNDPDRIATLWQARKVALWSAAGTRPDARVVITDVCVPVSELARAVEETQADMDASVLRSQAYIVGHSGDGNFHTFLLFNEDDPAEVEAAHQLADAMARRAIACGGTCTGEHGIGVGKRHLLREEAGSTALALMTSVKRSIDPAGIMNPGKVY